MPLFWLWRAGLCFWEIALQNNSEEEESQGERIQMLLNNTHEALFSPPVAQSVVILPGGAGCSEINPAILQNSSSLLQLCKQACCVRFKSWEVCSCSLSFWDDVKMTLESSFLCLWNFKWSVWSRCFAENATFCVHHLSESCEIFPHISLQVNVG